MSDPQYIQIVDCGRFDFALWKHPNESTFYPVHDVEGKCIEWAILHGYELVTSHKGNTIWKKVLLTKHD